MRYAILIEPLPEEEGGGYAAIFPDLPGCISDGETPMEAVANAEDALQAWLEVQSDRGIQIPKPGDSHREFSDSMEAYDRQIAELRDELEKARQRIRALEEAKAPWGFKRVADPSSRKREVA